VENLRAETTADEESWSYELVLHNRGRRAAELHAGSVVLTAGNVSLSPRTLVERQIIPPGDTLRVPHRAVFRRAEFPAARRHGSTAGGEMAVKWLFLGGYQYGGVIILTPEIRR
jgi:hypothetical protein